MKVYEEAGLISDVELPEISLPEMLDRSVRECPDSISMVYLGKKYTYKELGEFVDRSATALSKMGIKKGDVIAVQMINSPQFTIGVYGGLKAGATVTIQSPLLSSDELKEQLQRSGAKVLLTESEKLEDVKSIKAETKLERIIVSKGSDFSPDEEPLEEVEGAVQLRGLLSKTEPTPPKIEIDPKEDVAVLLFTGGTTGIPKGVMLTHYNLISGVVSNYTPATGSLMDSNRGNFSLIGALPFFHVFGFNLCLTMSLYWAGTILLVPDPRDLKLIYDLIKEYQPFWVLGVPTQFMKMVEDKDVDLREIKGAVTISGSAALPPEVSKKFEEKSGILLSEGLGHTETSSITHVNYVAVMGGLGIDFGLPIKLGSVGIPIANTEVEIIDQDSGKPVPAGKTGELIVKGPQTMKGYWPTPGDGLEDGWLYTGDVARMDDDGYFYIIDRIKDMINVSGYKVYGRVVDDILYEHPAVAQVAVIGIPDPKRPGSERVKALVVPREGYKPNEELKEDIIKYCREKLPPYAVPKSVEFRDELPLTVTDKIFKRKLREEEIAKMKEKGLL